jgi:hypothetical protein
MNRDKFLLEWIESESNFQRRISVNSYTEFIIFFRMDCWSLYVIMCCPYIMHGFFYNRIDVYRMRIMTMTEHFEIVIIRKVLYFSAKYLKLKQLRNRESL